jgi:nickel-dependent lactate racemase
MMLKYGDKLIELGIPQQAHILEVVDPEITISPAIFAQRLNGFLEAEKPNLGEVALVVADKTRLCGYSEFLPVLLDTLAHYGAGPSNVAIYIAYGTHPRQSRAESLAAYGKLFEKYRFIHHDAGDDSLFQTLGVTSRGTPISYRRDILKAGFLITFGAISHHYFAGYGGGRKLLFPGLGQQRAIYRNHGLFLDSATGDLAAGCSSGRIDGNPLAEDLEEVAAHCPADLAIHGILDSRGRVCDLLVGRGRTHFEKACAMHGNAFELADKGAYDLVVASCGGHPKDINFIQSHKAVHNAAAFVRDQGTLLVLARCPDGIGSKTFLPWFDLGGWDKAFQRLAQAYQGNGGTALAMMAKTRRIGIRMVTDLPEELCRRINVTKISPAEAVDMVKNHQGTLTVVPNASMVVKR